MSSATEQYLESMIASSEAVDVPTMVDYLIQDSLARGASDIHIEPWEDMVGVRVRVNGVLQWLVGIPLEHQSNIAGRFKVMANLESHTTGLPQDGKAAPENFGGVQLRGSIFKPLQCLIQIQRSLIYPSLDSMMKHWRGLKNWPPNQPG